MFRSTQTLSQTKNNPTVPMTPISTSQMPLAKPIKTGQYENLKGGSSNQLTQYFNFKLQPMISQTDATIAWQYNVPYLSPNQKFIFLCTQSFCTILQGYIGDQYPQTISVGLRGYSGFTNSNGTKNNKIIILNLYQTNVYSQNGVVARDLIYKSDTVAMWPLGGLRSLVFQVYIDQQTLPINFPIQNPLNVQFKIVHLSV